MTDKELKNLRRTELLEMLIESSKQIEQLKADHAAAEAALRAQLAEAMEKLNKRDVVLEEAGSIANACLQLNGVFEAAQQAADQYLDNIRSKYDQVDQACLAREAESQAKAEQILLDAQVRCNAMELTAKETSDVILNQAWQMKNDAKKECDDMIAQAKQQSEQYWQNVYTKLQEAIQSHEYLTRMFQDLHIGKSNAD